MLLPKHIIDRLKSCTDQHFALDDYRLNEDSIRELIPLLEANHNITRLSVRLNNLSGQPLKAFEGLPSRIQYVNLSQNNLDDNDLSTILNVFENVDRLDLSSNGFTNTAVKELTSKATQSEMKLIDNPIVEDESYKLLVEHLRKNRLNKDSNNSVSAGKKRKPNDDIDSLVKNSLLSEPKSSQADNEIASTISCSVKKLKAFIESDPVLLTDLRENFDLIMEALRQEIASSDPEIIN